MTFIVELLAPFALENNLPVVNSEVEWKKSSCERKLNALGMYEKRELNVTADSYKKVTKVTEM